MWCDDFDGDVYKLVPGSAEILAPAGRVKLITHGSLTGGVLNHPSTWNSYDGLTAFFVLDRGQDVEAANAQRDACRAARPQREWTPPFAPEGYWTDSAAVRCTGEQALRDWWVHGFNMVVAGRCVTPSRETLWFHFERLLYDARQVRRCTSAALKESREWARNNLAITVKNLLFIATPAEASA